MSAQKKEESKKNEATTVDAATVLETLKKNSARKGGSRIKNRNYKVSTPSNLDNVRLAPQAINCVGVILGIGKEEITETELFNALEDNAVVFGESKQTPWKIFQYYRKPIMEAGFLREVVAAA